MIVLLCEGISLLPIYSSRNSWQVVIAETLVSFLSNMIPTRWESELSICIGFPDWLIINHGLVVNLSCNKGRNFKLFIHKLFLPFIFLIIIDYLWCIEKFISILRCNFFVLKVTWHSNTVMDMWVNFLFYSYSLVLLLLMMQDSPSAAQTSDSAFNYWN